MNTVPRDKAGPIAGGDGSPPPNHSLRELAAFFLRLGTTAFGGPAAHVAMMEDELVRRRGWLSREKFLDLLGASNLIPGPSSSELAIHIGYLRAGWAGLLVAGSCFILPAALMVAALAWAYVRFGRLPASAAILYGIKPAVIAIVLQALWRLGRTAVKNRLLAGIALVSLALSAAALHPLYVLLIAGAVMVLVDSIRRSRRPARPLGQAVLLPVLPSASTTAAAAGGAATVAVFSLSSLFLLFLKIGAIVFGSGYVLLAFLRADLVAHRGWLTDAQLVDAVAIGQVTPGPVFTTATFIGYLLGRGRGAVLATVAIFLPAFILVAASGPLVSRLRNSKTAGAFLDGVNVGALALMAVVTWQLAQASIVDLETGILLVIFFLAVVRLRLNPTWVMAGGALAGLLTQVHLH